MIIKYAKTNLNSIIHNTYTYLYYVYECINASLLFYGFNAVSNRIDAKCTYTEKLSYTKEFIKTKLLILSKIYFDTWFRN